MSAQPKPSLNDAQVAFLGLLSKVDDRDLPELQKVVAKFLLSKIRKDSTGDAKKLGVDTEEGYEKFIEENHNRTPYK